MTPIKSDLYLTVQMPAGGATMGPLLPTGVERGPARFLTMEHFLLKQLGVTYWRKNFIDLINCYSDISLAPLGFPETGRSFTPGIEVTNLLIQGATTSRVLKGAPFSCCALRAVAVVKRCTRTQ